ncbi:unnamed protein product [Vicia faba]|uniref:Uncharacterized protein n=1 Tax=Vicia faba TaxID=3906 RepID=A0AAV0YI71_VICFA|nr:unnamed protein product [Vicia faba]
MSMALIVASTSAIGVQISAVVTSLMIFSNTTLVKMSRGDSLLNFIKVGSSKWDRLSEGDEKNTHTLLFCLSIIHLSRGPITLGEFVAAVANEDWDFFKILSTNDRRSLFADASRTLKEKREVLE